MATPAVPATPAAAPAASSAPAPGPAPAASTQGPGSAASQVAAATQPESQQPAGGAPPAAQQPAATAAAPKATDFPNTQAGQYDFLKALNQYGREHPEGAPKPVDAQAAPGPEAVPAEAAQAVAGEMKPGEAPPAAEAAPATPRQLADLMEKTPEFGAFMEAHPEVKGPVFALARKLAEVEPILAIAPTVGDAEFLRDTSTSMMALKTASLRTIENPESVPEFLNLFDSQFAQVDGEGKPVADAQGRPVLDADHAAVVNGLVNREMGKFRSQFATEIEQIKGRLGGYYPNEAEKTLDTKRLQNLELADLAFQVIDQVRSGEYFETEMPAPPADATQEQKAWFERQKAELDRQREELKATKDGATKEQRTAAAAAFNTSVRNDLGMTAGRVIGEALKAIEEAGVYIPEMYKQEKYRDPSGKEWNTPRIAAELFIAFENELMKPGSRTLLEITQHQLLPQNEQTKKIRQDYYARKAAEMIPQIVQKEVDRIQKLVKVDQSKQSEMLAARRQAAGPEPMTGGSSLPSGASDQQVMAAAEEAAKKLPEWGAANPRDRQAMLITQVHKMRKR